ncbi:hypothetical protein ACQUQP_12065 [Marinobacterium sp. YM272]|uniref:hypothetical protein n=1 Tax=Marinobacterium sp. YM272 TaxID=3421654 RepID=UPI003D7F53AE
MNTMTFRGHWYAVEGIIVASALIFYIGVNLPSSLKYEEALSETETGTVIQENTRRGTRSYSASDIALISSDDLERRRVRADASITADNIAPEFDDRRNRADY